MLVLLLIVLLIVWAMIILIALFPTLEEADFIFIIAIIVVTICFMCKK